jgi:hypothetical protein
MRGEEQDETKRTAAGEGPSGFSFSDSRVRTAAGAKPVDAANLPTDDEAKPLSAAPPNSFRRVMSGVPDGLCSNVVIGNSLVFRISVLSV